VRTFVTAQKIWHSMSFGFLAQNKDNADQQHANHWLNRCDHTDQSHSEIYQYNDKNDGFDVGGQFEDAVMYAHHNLMENIERLNGEMVNLGRREVPI
jgi:hypothetical protein